MPGSFNGDALLQQVKEQAAKRLLRAAVFFQQQQMQRLNTSAEPFRKRIKFKKGDFVLGPGGGKRTGYYVTRYARPSKPGEYPHKRTGNLQANVVLSASSIAQILADGLSVKSGLRENADYGLVLEFLRDRLGFMQTMKDLQPELKAILEA